MIANNIDATRFADHQFNWAQNHTRLSVEQVQQDKFEPNDPVKT